ncbi:MAG: hypothetical protein ACRD50_16615 [Candidatus Acidiferrales bacterium]
MRVKIVGECTSAKSIRSLLRKAGIAVTEFLPADAVTKLPSGGYLITIEESESPNIAFDSADSQLERNILRHVSLLSKLPVIVDRPGGMVHSDCEIRLIVPRNDSEQQIAVEFGVLRGLVDTIGNRGLSLPQPPSQKSWFDKFLGGTS